MYKLSNTIGVFPKLSALLSEFHLKKGEKDLITCRPDSRLVAIFALFADSANAYGDSNELAGVVVSAFLFTPFLINLAGCCGGKTESIPGCGALFI